MVPSCSRDLGHHHPTMMAIQSQTGDRVVTEHTEAQPSAPGEHFPKNCSSAIILGLLSCLFALNADASPLGAGSPNRQTRLGRNHSSQKLLPQENGATRPRIAPRHRPGEAADGSSACSSGGFATAGSLAPRASLSSTSAGFRRNQLLRWPGLPHQLILTCGDMQEPAGPAGSPDPWHAVAHCVPPVLSLAASFVGAPVTLHAARFPYFP